MFKKSDKYNTTLKWNRSYSKTISWFKTLSTKFQRKSCVAIVEYRGDYPINSLSLHGNSKAENRQYVWTCPDTKDALKRKLKENISVIVIFKDLSKANSETAPRDYRVIENMKREQKKQITQTCQGDSLADEMLEVFKLLRVHPFVQEVNSTKAHAPQSFFIQYFVSKNTDYVVGVERTFNLGTYYVVCFTYKNI